MFSHVVVGSDDLQLSKKFYDAIFRFTGIDDAGIDALNRPFYRKGDQRFIITLPINGQPATCANEIEERRAGQECRSRWSPYH